MTATEFDPVRFKEQQRVNWDAISSGWLTVVETFERGASVVTERLLDLAGVAPGMSVLDVGTGVGEPALSAAAVVGPTGRVVGVDLSPRMVELARHRATGFDNAEFLVGDVESLDLVGGGFDVVLSRWGLMFAPDRRAAFRSLAAALRPGGVLAASTWGPPETAPMMSLGFGVLARRLELAPPPPGTPGPFSMSDADALVAEVAAAGFTDVSVTAVDVPFVLNSSEAYAVFSKAVLPPGLRQLVRERLGAEDDPSLWAEVGAAVAGRQGPDGRVELPSRALCLRATAPIA
ncbi:class I SAM-dependent methyltransferase [Saccharothrix sp. NRRL B-16314]|uniref:class I SAM-dependent methyltransferase n=1 Tax=Saccharothrix sp. NRRL B-16314 TaxID=1463825 RepID=UPI0005244951|nr:methyltransferase domain-containing protein [Saccharothrix sp. NRRL B-16314]